MILSTHKRSSVADTHLNQLAKPNIIPCSKEKLAACTPEDLLGLGAPSACPNVCFYSTKEKHSGQPLPSRGKAEGDPWNKWLWQLLGAFPQTPALRASEPPAAGSSQPAQPAQRHGRGFAGRGETQEAILWERSNLTLGTKICNGKGESGCLLFWSR